MKDAFGQRPVNVAPVRIGDGETSLAAHHEQIAAPDSADRTSPTHEAAEEVRGA
jgi:hypothetical protein